MQYLTVGTREIKDDLFINIEDTEPSNVKPKGGLWLTKYENNEYNEWVDFLLENPNVFYYKSTPDTLWKQPCSLVTLKKDANILTLDNKDVYEYLKKNYPRADNNFSYQAISNIYDGIYVNLYNLLKISNDFRLFKFGVNSLILFNLNCIDYYQSGIVHIEPFDFEQDFYELPLYSIKCEDTKKRVLKK